ncbi:hypothetical protein QA640_36020 [Bradyrhizobium sp. CB82]|uniref:hypothetical protein n=1 Tax=Bradyrhizobium sp. CB82 TaxID=3039159 RepID=UPI0024B1FDFF|nr:hypothetical protein [Bradyrhizobium sp. CB82]WFU39709.1 hypothetical protein QA640_36020 [Bradyrhizobium sp. CB82]
MTSNLDTLRSAGLRRNPGCALPVNAQTGAALVTSGRLEAASMERYTAYLVGPDGHAVGFVEFICSDEGAAKERVRQVANDYAIELWQSDRKIVAYEAQR